MYVCMYACIHVCIYAIQFHAAFAALPQNSKYFSSALASLPQNNLMAAFGSTPSGEKFVPGQPCSWRGTSGVY